MCVWCGVCGHPSHKSIYRLCLYSMHMRYTLYWAVIAVHKLNVYDMRFQAIVVAFQIGRFCMRIEMDIVQQMNRTIKLATIYRASTCPQMWWCINGDVIFEIWSFLQRSKCFEFSSIVCSHQSNPINYSLVSRPNASKSELAKLWTSQWPGRSGLYTLIYVNNFKLEKFFKSFCCETKTIFREKSWLNSCGSHGQHITRISTNVIPVSVWCVVCLCIEIPSTVCSLLAVSLQRSGNVQLVEWLGHFL